MNLETKIIIYKFTPQVFTLTLKSLVTHRQEQQRDAASRGVPSILVSFYKILRELKLHSLKLF
jgi:hypothetical protein